MIVNAHLQQSELQSREFELRQHRVYAQDIANSHRRTSVNMVVALIHAFAVPIDIATTACLHWTQLRTNMQQTAHRSRHLNRTHRHPRSVVKHPSLHNRLATQDNSIMLYSSS